MANTGIRQLTTVVGGYAKRIWYSLNGTTPTNELMSIDDAGKFKCVSEQITGLSGTGTRMVVADATGNLRASDCCLDLTTGNNVSIKIIKNASLADNTFSDLFNFYSSGGFSSANYTGIITGELKIKISGLNKSYVTIDSYRSFSISARQQASGNITITSITAKDTFDDVITPTVTVRQKSGNTNTSSKIELSVTFPNFLECNVLAEIECLSMSNLSYNLIRIN